MAHTQGINTVCALTACPVGYAQCDAIELLRSRALAGSDSSGKAILTPLMAVFSAISARALLCTKRYILCI